MNLSRYYGVFIFIGFWCVLLLLNDYFQEISFRSHEICECRVVAESVSVDLHATLYHRNPEYLHFHKFVHRCYGGGFLITNGG